MKLILRFLACFIAVLAVLGLSACGSSGNAKSAAPVADGSELTIRVLDIGQGDAILLGKDGKWALIDSGDVDHRPQMQAYLQKYGVKELSNVIITHPHADHVGGMAAVFKTVKVDDIYDNGVPTTTNTYRTYLKTIKEKKINYHKTKAGDTIAILPGVDFHVVAPVKILTEGKSGKPAMNSNSVVGRLSYGNFSMLFTGDAEKDEEKTILESGANIKSDVLKVGHHGSKTSSGTDFLKAVSPKFAVLSAGRGNSYGLPHDVTLKNLAKAGIKVLRTDQDGTVTITSTGSGDYSVKKEK